MTGKILIFGCFGHFWSKTHCMWWHYMFFGCFLNFFEFWLFPGDPIILCPFSHLMIPLFCASRNFVLVLLQIPLFSYTWEPCVGKIYWNNTWKILFPKEQKHAKYTGIYWRIIFEILEFCSIYWKIYWIILEFFWRKVVATLPRAYII